MLAQVHFPQSLSGESLDRYLADGWFRMGQTIFTTNFLNFKNEFYSAIWLRIKLKEIATIQHEDKLRRIKQRFTVSIDKAVIDEERERLFSRYRQEVSFEPSSSINALLFGRASHNIFDTYEVTVRDNGKLIACGYFDLGYRSVAGISSFYDHDYKKYSLGKFLILQKIEFAKESGYEFFYPGYFVPGYQPFDYKRNLYPEAQEFFQLSSGLWNSISHFDSSLVPIHFMRTKLTAFSQSLSELGLSSRLMKYEFYDANLVPDLSHMELFDFPAFVQYFDYFDNAINSLVVFDVRDQKFHWLIVKSVWKSDHTPQSPDSYCEHLLKVEESVISTESASQMALLIAEAIKAQLLKQEIR